MKVSAGTIARTVVLGLALINQVLTSTGHGIINVSDDEVNSLISTTFTVITAIAAWWKNNSFTKAAIAADEALTEYRDAESGGDEDDGD